MFLPNWLGVYQVCQGRISSGEEGEDVDVDVQSVQGTEILREKNQTLNDEGGEKYQVL